MNAAEHDVQWFPAAMEDWPRFPVMTEGNKARVHVARLWHKGELLPGYAKDGWGYFVHEGKAIKRPESDYQVLFGNNVKFFPRGPVVLEDSLFAVSHTLENRKLFLGSFVVNGVYLCGEVRDGVCNIAADENTVLSEPANFRILMKMKKAYNRDLPYYNVHF